MIDNTFFLMLNGGDEALECRLPPAAWGRWWRTRLDTASDRERVYGAGAVVPLLAHHGVLLAEVTGDEEGKGATVAAGVRRRQ